MRQEDLLLLLQREPPPLLRLYLTGGMTIEISDPELVHLSRSVLEVVLPALNGLQREAVVSLLHVVWVEVIDPPA